MFIFHSPVGDIVFFQWLPLEVYVGGAGAAGIWSGRLLSLTRHTVVSHCQRSLGSHQAVMNLRNCSSVQESKLLKN